MNEIVARCGYRCDLCPAYYKNIHSREDQERVSAGWLKYVGDDVPPEEVPCPGCLAVSPYTDDQGDQLRSPDPECPVRPCVIERGLKNCAHCVDFPCEKLDSRMNFMENRHGDFSGVPENDFDLFIRPYLSKERLVEIKKTLNTTNEEKKPS